MDIKNKLWLLTLQLRVNRIILNSKLMLRTLYPTTIWSYLMVHGSLIMITVFGFIILVTNIF